MNVLYVINSFSWGGAEKLVYDLSMNIVKNVQSVSIVALYSVGDDTENKMILDLNEKGIKTLIVGKRAKKDRIKTIKLIKKFAKYNQADIIHGYCQAPSLYAKVVGKTIGVPIISTIHSTKGYSPIKEKCTAWMTNKYISICKAAEEYMIHELGLDSKKIIRIYNALDVDKFSNVLPINNFWEEFGGKDGDLNVINVARVSEPKNQICILKAIKECKDRGVQNIRLYILGKYSKDKIYLELQDFMAKNNLTNNVVFLGQQDNVQDFLANADVFVMTSFYEGLSVAFLEAVISGIPIIATDMPFVRELNDISICSTIVMQDDYIELSKAILNKTYNTQDEKTMFAFKKLFSLEEFVHKHVNLYKEVLRSYK